MAGEIRTKAATNKFRDGHDRIFSGKIQRGRWIQDPVTGELVEASQYQRPESSSLSIFVDQFEAYDSPVTGEVVNNRRQRDYDLKKNGCRPYEGFKTEKAEAERHNSYQEQQLSNKLKETAQRTLYEIQHGYRRVRDE